MTSPALAVSINGVRRYKHPNRHGGAPVYASVTHTVKAMPAPALISWAAKVTAERAVERSETWLTMPASEAVAYLKAAPNQQRDAGGARGTDTHGYIEHLLQGGKTEAANGYEQAAAAFVRDFQPTTELLEQTVFNETHLFAGTLDWLGTFEAAPELKRCIVDWKTSKGVYAEHMVQLVGGYAMGAEYYLDQSLQEIPWQPPDSAVVVLLQPDANYQVMQVPLDARLSTVFRACLVVRKFEASGIQAQRIDPETPWNQVWLEQWLEKHPDRQLELADACRQAGIEIRRRYRTTEDVKRILAMISLLDMEAPKI
jgi:hypothetical protein